MTPDKRVEEIVEEFMNLHPEQGKWRIERHVAKDWLTQTLTQYHQDLINEMEHYWNYAGEWHDAGCAFVCVDHGVCNCDLEGNKTLIKSK